MKVKKTIWIPVLIGIVSGSLILAAALADFFIPLGGETSIGIGEIFTTLSSALGGPIAIIPTLLVPYIGVILNNPDLYTETQTLYIVLADATAHLSAMLVVAICYHRFLYPWAKKTGIFIVVWWMINGVYYLVLLSLSVVLLDIADPGFSATFPPFADFMPEFLGTALVTSLIWLAAPIRYRLPLWVEPKNALDQNLEKPGE